MGKLTPIRAIRAKCLDCSGGRPSIVKKCSSQECDLFPYRFGKNPRRKGIGGGRRDSSCKTAIKACSERKKSHSTDEIQSNHASPKERSLRPP